MKLYKVRYEKNKGYIPSDKVTLDGIHFESFSLSHIPECKARFDVINNTYKADKYNIKKDVMEYAFESITQEFLVLNGYSNLEDYKQSYPLQKVFYFNVNFDGVQVFINRGFESKK